MWKKPSPGEEVGPSAAWDVPVNLTWLEPREGVPLMAEVMMLPIGDMMKVDSSRVAVGVGSFPHPFALAASSTGL